MSDDLFDDRLTEHRNPRTVGIDRASPLEIVDLINSEDRQVPQAVQAERESIARAIELAVECFGRGGRLIYVGAGTSGRLGVLDAAECPPTFGTDPEMVQGIIAGGYVALVRSQEGAEDSGEDGARAIDEANTDTTDFVFGIATSSTTPFVRGALSRATELGARTGFLCCTEPGSEMREAVDVCVVPLVGPEVIAGSTRMKAGTATKLVLNSITTGAMIRLGKVYGNLMVDLQAMSDKLVDRSQRIVMAATGCSRDRALRSIKDAAGSVKHAIVMEKVGVAQELADLYLTEADGFVGGAIEIGAQEREAWVAGDSPYGLYALEPPNEASLELTRSLLRDLPRRISHLITDVENKELRQRPGEEKWCVKEHIEHLIDCDLMMGERIGSMLTQEDPSIADRNDEEANKKIGGTGARGAPIAMLLRRLADGRAALSFQVEEIPDDDFARTGRHEAYGKISLYQLLRHLVRHDEHHLQAIQNLLAK
jgi:N-acetylmuramic acid 6-phosphate etherase